MPSEPLPTVLFVLPDAARIGFQHRAGEGPYLTAVRRAVAVVEAQEATDQMDAPPAARLPCRRRRA